MDKKLLILKRIAMLPVIVFVLVLAAPVMFVVWLVMLLGGALQWLWQETDPSPRMNIFYRWGKDQREQKARDAKLQADAEDRLDNRAASVLSQGDTGECSPATDRDQQKGAHS